MSVSLPKFVRSAIAHLQAESAIRLHLTQAITCYRLNTKLLRSRPPGPE